MLKNILNLEGAQQLSNKEQKEINGGINVCLRTFRYIATPAQCAMDGGVIVLGKCIVTENICL
ncbi:hypothetical protein FVB9288_00067 [Flavobacterium sp. CECT 9288]|uniref:hypothetical protein n=1 Tax=Flavobacterium sp. CECT 9288 TaxID=2845819 RepID=UPI001E364EB3|nr:hypothetical protein [Flavobacterium sp. CECT 9288]CAH0334484.1 hypothetical protein FVB9288_00067 [Flavobacterium sp. CECT 9288]